MVFAQGVFAYVYITVQEVLGSGLVWRSPRPRPSCKISLFTFQAYQLQFVLDAVTVTVQALIYNVQAFLETEKSPVSMTMINPNYPLI